MRRAIDGNPADQLFAKRQGDELKKFVTFSQKVQQLAKEDKVDTIYANW